MEKIDAAVLPIVRSVPKGKVVSYGQVATYLGALKAAREVGYAMGKLGNETDFPWWRVLGGAGKITISDNPRATARMQQELLEKEGVVFRDALTLDMTRYQYRADEAALKQFGLSQQWIEAALEKFPLETQGGLF